MKIAIWRPYSKQDFEILKNELIYLNKGLKMKEI